MLRKIREGNSDILETTLIQLEKDKTHQ